MDIELVSLDPEDTEDMLDFEEIDDDEYSSNSLVSAYTVSNLSAIEKLRV
jgi:hypothetical protein